MKDRTYPPCMLVVNGKEYILNKVNKERVKEKMYKLYTPETLVEEWVDGNKVNEIELQYIFNNY